MTTPLSPSLNFEGLNIRTGNACRTEDDTVPLASDVELSTLFSMGLSSDMAKHLHFRLGHLQAHATIDASEIDAPC